MQASCVNTDVSIVCYRSVSEGSSLCIHVVPRRQRLGPSLTVRLRLFRLQDRLPKAEDENEND
jgi:hypothetical protein